MRVLYFPGCTLKNKAANFDESMVSAMAALGSELQELDRWNCCGTVYSMTDDDLMQQLAPMRNLLRAEQQGGGVLLTPCSMCYNTLKRAQTFVGTDPDRLQRVRDIMYKEDGVYEGRVDVVHPLVFLRDQIGFEQVKQAVTKPLGGLKLAAYYGCLLTRPADLAIDNPDSPRVMDDLLQALGAEPVSFGQNSECCGAYQTLTRRAVTLGRIHAILGSAAIAGAQGLVTSCPLCAYNLDQMQREAVKVMPDTARMPIFYFSELMAVAFGQSWSKEWTALHHVDPHPLIEAVGGA